MLRFFKKLFKALAYAIAGIVILLAIGVGLLRLFLPRLPEYQEQIKAWASEAIGVQVEFSAMDARWGLNGPELNFLDAELIRPESEKRLVAADEVSISVALLRLFSERTVAIDRVLVRDSNLEVRLLDTGELWVQGGPVDELLPEGGGRMQGGAIELVVENITVQFLQPGDERPQEFTLTRALVRSDEQRLAIDADIRPPPTIGNRISLLATYLPGLPAEQRTWDVSARIDDVQLPGLTDLVRREEWTFTGGEGDLDVSMTWSPAGVQSASVDLDLESLTKDGADPVAVEGLIEYRRDEDGWLLAANDLRLETPDGTWPESSFRFDAGEDESGALVMLDARADYLNLRDVRFALPLLGGELRRTLQTLDPRGEVRGLDLTLSDLGAGKPQFALSAELSDVGFDTYERWPGLRGFSARIRADSSGGRIEVRSEGMQVLPFEYLQEPVVLDSVLGTIIWRRSGERTTILSDNIAVRNADFDSQSNVQVTVDGDAAPVIDLASRWSLTDLGTAKSYIPQNIMKPKLYQWFQDALLSGRIDNGRTRLYGPLDKFPFDNDEGRFLLQATVEDGLFRYLNNWPAAELVSLDVILENTRLYTTENIAVTEGREVRNSVVEIADLRNPVLTIRGQSDGDMQSLLSFSKNSPINRWLGNQLDRVSVAGSAKTDLDLVVPLRKGGELSVRVVVEASDGELSVEGLKPPVTAINGSVIIEKDRVTSDQLVGRFLDDDISISLSPAPAQEESFQVVANVSGSVSMQALTEGFDIPVANLLDGSTDYTAAILFPAAKREVPAPLTIRIESDGAGVDVRLPPPFGKTAADVRTLKGDIRFAGDGAIATSGQADDFAWDALFMNDEGLDFDRGTIALGSAAATAAEIRGLHIVGETQQFYLNDWLALSETASAGPNLVDRIRSADVAVRDIRLLGQRLDNHTVRLDRSARDWLIQIDGEEVSGSVTLPYEFRPDTTLTLDMERLLLPGDDEAVDDSSQVDPRGLPAITVRADEFSLGGRYFGAVEADIVRTEEGLEAERIVAKDASFEIIANGSWVAHDEDPTGFKTFAMGGLTSTDIKATMTQLNYDPGLNGEELSVIFDVNWSGGPTKDFLKTLSGDVQVRFGPGQLDDIEPGAGRVFGLLSIVALPRRLSLDFRDVFQKGFGFDSIEGQFRIDNGDSYTCNLSLEGPAAAIGIVGRTGLNQRDYQQSAIVSANFGNSLPIVGGLVAGPQVAAALLIFSQIFKKPLQDLSQVYYDIEGSWDEPIIEGSDAASFAEAGRMAGCIDAP